MASYNRVIMMGNLTRDPEYKQLTSGQTVCRFGLASNRQFKNRQTGAMIQEVCFVDVDVWGPQADVCNQYLQKGRGVLIEGRLKFDSWQDNEGQRRNKHSIVADRVTFLSSATSVEDQSFTQNQAEQVQQTQTNNDKANKPEQAEPVAAAQNTKETEGSESSEKSQNNKTTTSGEINFKDEQPFEDDLPF